MRRWALVGIFMVLSLLVAGCGPTSDGEFVAAKRSPSPTTPVVNVPDLKSQLLKVSDLPTGWSTDQDDEDDDAEGSECLTNAKKLFNPIAKETADFTKGSMPSLSETVAYFPRVEQATVALTSVFEAYIACQKFWIKYDGKKLTGDIDELSFPLVGEQSRVLTSEIDVQGFTLGLHQILLRKGNIVLTMMYFDLGTPDVDEFQDLVKRAYAKLA